MNATTASARLREALRDARSPSGPPPRPTRRARQFDVLLALVLGVTTLHYAVDNWRQQADGLPPGVVRHVPPSGLDGLTLMVTLAFVASAALALRRRYPLAMLCVVTAAALLTPYDVSRLTFYAFVVAVYSAAVHSPYRAATLAVLPVAVVLVGTAGNSVRPIVPNEYVALLILAPMAVAAIGVRTWRLRSDESRTRLSALEREQTEALRRAVEHERARIARELHDVVTHNVSVMIIQAGAARTVMKTSPEQAGEALLAVEAGGRAAMTELRHVMGLLTMGGEDDGMGEGTDMAGTDAGLAPQPGLGQLEALVGRVRDTGLPVGLTVTGPPRPLPPGVELTAYRVVQEALTNSVKHASGSAAAVTVEYGQERLRVEVTDTGGHMGEGALTGNGRGLIGLRERLAVYEGTLNTGRRLTGGYRVEALIPLEAP
ncbi:sensor histidine kinase [Streptomyces sp. NBC_00059]|uniref:sensor histidine kinase n=1 Tax=Streptomyces sp. NBC_00059 TaxID=2975635 RepID=UPI0022532319|nr:histidine kinase [Streptomyces sp. NBC_00059]MCX5414574.1 histidine kinase [Streptomyces sp. NBC_00059]